MTNKKFTNYSTDFFKMFRGDFISVYVSMQTNSYGININCCIIENNIDKQIAEFELENKNIVVFYTGNVLNEMHDDNNKICNEIKEFFNSLGFIHTGTRYHKNTNLTYIHFDKIE